MVAYEARLEDLLMEPKQPKIDEAEWFAERHSEDVGHETKIGEPTDNGEVLIYCLDCPWKLWSSS